MKRILLTGAFGILGEAIQEEARGMYELVCADINVPQGREDEPADVNDKETVLALAEGCDAIIHTIKYRSEWDPENESKNSERFYRVNVIGADNVFQAAMKHGISRVVLSSSIEVSIGTAWNAGGAGVIDEGSPPRLDSLYNLNKLQVEMMASFYYHNFGITSACLRYMEFSRIDKMKLGYWLLARSLWRNDVARANLCALESDRITCEPINIGPKTPLTNADIIDSLADYDGVVEKYYPGATERIANVDGKYKKALLWPVASITRARRLLGWTPQWTFETFLEGLPHV